jgi:hypothetical protein
MIAEAIAAAPARQRSSAQDDDQTAQHPNLVRPEDPGLIGRMAGSTQSEAPRLRKTLERHLEGLDQATTMLPFSESRNAGSPRSAVELPERSSNRRSLEQ